MDPELDQEIMGYLKVSTQERALESCLVSEYVLKKAIRLSQCSVQLQTIPASQEPGESAVMGAVTLAQMPFRRSQLLRRSCRMVPGWLVLLLQACELFEPAAVLLLGLFDFLGLCHKLDLELALAGLVASGKAFHLAHWLRAGLEYVLHTLAADLSHQWYEPGMKCQAFVGFVTA